MEIQGYLAHEKQHSLRTLQWDFAQGPMGALWGGLFFIREAPLYIIYWLTPILTIRSTAVRYLNKRCTPKIEMLILINQGPHTDRCFCVSEFEDCILTAFR